MATRSGALHRPKDLSTDDQTRSWSSRIAHTEDPFIARHTTNHANLQNMRVEQRTATIRGAPVEERRTDGDRYTQMMTATEWLKQKDEHNNLRSVPRASGPPVLPRKSARDHLSDRNRDTVLYDPARPDVAPRVRVTQRSSFDNCSAEGRRHAIQNERFAQAERARQLELEARLEAEHAAEANELLELRSLGIRGIIAARETAHRSPIQTRAAAKKAAGAGAAAPMSTPMEPTSREPASMGEGPVQGWGVVRQQINPHKQVFVDGQPLDLDLSWIAGPLERKLEGFRGSPPKVREAEQAGGSDPWGPVPFSMPASKKKADQRRATAVRASG